MSIVNILENKLNNVSGESEVLSLSTLQKSGICGSSNSAKKLLKSGQIPSIRIGNKTLFAKKDIVDFLHKKASSIAVE